MNRGAEHIAVELKAPCQNGEREVTLCEHVSTAVEGYFRQINGHPACNLYEFVISEVERPLIETVLKQVGHNQSKAAKILGISRSTLRKKIEKYSLD